MANLAALGGTPVLPDGMRIVWPETGEAEKAALMRVLERGAWCRVGVADDICETTLFENEWAAYHAAAYCVAICNGTAALICAFRALGVGHGDEVIVPAMTFVATSDAVVLCGGVPVFADIDPDTYQIDPKAVEAAIGPRTKAICAVHYAGYPADLDALGDISRKTGIPVVEDCAHAQGSEWRGRKVGAHITAGCFSFQQSKSLTAGEGGAVVTDSEELADSVWAVHNCGRARGPERYDHVVLGGNFRLSEWGSAILRAQLTRLEEQTARRESSGKLLSRELPKIGGLTPLRPDERITRRGYYFYVIRYDEAAWGGMSRDVFLSALRAEGMSAGAAYSVPVYMNQSYQHGLVAHRRMPCTRAEFATLREQVVTSNHALLDVRNAEALIDACAKIRANVDELRRLAAG